MDKRETELLQNILKKITPTSAGRAKMKMLAKKLEAGVAAACEEFQLEAVVRVEGSVAKDTWLREEPDLDIFLRVSPSIPRNSLGEIALKIARKATAGSRQIERFAEHPYLEAFVDSIRVNIVPCYLVEQGEWLSATDRTPYHTDYVNSHMDQSLRAETRLLKKFLKGIQVYGAEIKVGGFSGYLCELLILHYKSFHAVLQGFAGHTERKVLDIEGYFENKQKDLTTLFPEPLVIVDPVDKSRNVASAVQPQKLFTLVAASREFLKNPRKIFFYPDKTHKLSRRELKNKLTAGPSYLFIRLNSIEAVPDVLWGQLYKSTRSLKKLLELNDFQVLREAVWTDEKTGIFFVFELQKLVLSNVKKHFGPPLQFENECERFLQKYKNNPALVCGPYVEDGRWNVQLARNFTGALELIDEKLRGDPKRIGVAGLVSKAFSQNYQVFANTEVFPFYSSNVGFAEFLTDFLSGKPKWLYAEDS